MKTPREKFIEENPLAKFSIYTLLQAEELVVLGKSIKSTFDKIILRDNLVDLTEGDPYGKIWLWVLGTYEVIRTMADAKWKRCWSNQKYEEIVEFKRHLAHLRVPFAKQEHRTGGPLGNENSVFAFESTNASFIYRVKDRTFNVREEIDRFESLVRGISSNDVLRDLRDVQG